MPAVETYPVKLNINLDGTAKVSSHSVQLNINLDGVAHPASHAVQLNVNLETFGEGIGEMVIGDDFEVS